MSLTRETLMKMSKYILAGLVFDSTLAAINYKLKELKTNFRKLKSDLAISRMSTTNSPNSLFW